MKTFKEEVTEITKLVITTKLSLNPISISKDYREKWNINCEDFVLLCNHNVPLRNTLYRIGGINNPKVDKDDYFMLLKYTEDIYDKLITTDPKRKYHLKSQWCIIDKYGTEKVVFDSFQYGSIIGGCIYYTNNRYYNIETNLEYAYSSTHLQSEDYIFVEDRYNNDESKRGVYKIKKSDGTFEFFK